MINKENIKKIAVFRALQLGDMLCAVPALRALRAHFPQAEIVLVGLPWAVSFVNRFHSYLDRHLTFPGHPALPEQKFDARRFIDFLTAVQHEQFDLVLQMQGNGTFVNIMMEFFDARTSSGFYCSTSYRPNDNYLRYPDGIHEIQRHLALMRHLGIPSLGSYLEFPLTIADLQDYKRSGLDLSGGSYVCIHPGSRGAYRQWPTDHFAALGDHCYNNGLQVVITGTTDELKIVTEVAGKMLNKPIIAAGKTSLGAMGVLINDAALLISNCTGPSHIAAALHTPSVIISMDGEPGRWAPLDQNRHPTIDWTVNPDYQVVLQTLETMIRYIQQGKFRDVRDMAIQNA